tara:strand:- start:5380 stop:5721 length:342 start_codon:yes stop_codon:yes gene_type:complete
MSKRQKAGSIPIDPDIEYRPYWQNISVDLNRRPEGKTRYIYESLLTLTRIERSVLTVFYGLGSEEPKDLVETAEYLGLELADAQEIWTKAITRIRYNLPADNRKTKKNYAATR